MKRSGPRAHRPVPLNVEISFRLTNDLRKTFELASLPGCSAHVLQAENGLHNLGDCHLGVRRAGTVVETGAVKVVRGEWSARIDGLWSGELERLFM